MGVVGLTWLMAAGPLPVLANRVRVSAIFLDDHIGEVITYPTQLD